MTVVELWGHIWYFVTVKCDLLLSFYVRRITRSTWLWEFDKATLIIVAELLSEPYIKQPHQPKQRNDNILRYIFPLIDVIFRFDGEKDVVRIFRVRWLCMIELKMLPLVCRLFVDVCCQRYGTGYMGSRCRSSHESLLHKEHSRSCYKNGKDFSFSLHFQTFSVYLSCLFIAYHPFHKAQT